MLAILKMIFMLLPLIKEAIVIVEALFPESGKGALKLDLVKAVVEAIYTGHLSEGVPAFSGVWAGLVKVIAILVPLLTGKTQTLAPVEDHSSLAH